MTRCPKCGRPRVDPEDEEWAHEPGCECDSCVALCWDGPDGPQCESGGEPWERFFEELRIELVARDRRRLVEVLNQLADLAMRRLRLLVEAYALEIGIDHDEAAYTIRDVLTRFVKMIEEDAKDG